MMMAENHEAPEHRDTRAQPGLEPPEAHVDRTMYRVGKGIFGPLVRMVYRPTVIGRNNVPKKGRLILASNHRSFIDSIAIPLMAPRPVQYLAKASYFEGTGTKGAFQRAFFSAAGAVPLQRGAGQAAQSALDQSKRIIESETALALYPEGTRSRDGRLYKGRTGIGWLVLETGAIVVPVGLRGTENLLPADTTRPHFAKVTVTFGEAMDFSYLQGVNSGKNRREITDAVMTAIQKLTGQEEAGVYNEIPAAGPVDRIRQVIRNETERVRPTLPMDE